MPQYKYSRDDYYRLTNAPCLDVARALGMEINERERQFIEKGLSITSYEQSQTEIRNYIREEIETVMPIVMKRYMERLIAMQAVSTRTSAAALQCCVSVLAENYIDSATPEEILANALRQSCRIKELRQQVGHNAAGALSGTLHDDFTEAIFQKLTAIRDMLPPKGQAVYKLMPKPVKQELNSLTHFMIDSIPEFRSLYDEILDCRRVYNEMLHSDDSSYGKLQMAAYMGKVVDEIEAGVGNTILSAILRAIKEKTKNPPERNSTSTNRHSEWQRQCTVQLISSVRALLGPLTHSNLPRSAFLENKDLGIPVYSPSTSDYYNGNSNYNSDTCIIRCMGIGVLTGNSDDDEAEEGTAAAEYHTDTDVYTSFYAVNIGDTPFVGKSSFSIFDIGGDTPRMYEQLKEENKELIKVTGSQSGVSYTYAYTSTELETVYADEDDRIKIFVDNPANVPDEDGNMPYVSPYKLLGSYKHGDEISLGSSFKGTVAYKIRSTSGSTLKSGTVEITCPAGGEETMGWIKWHTPSREQSVVITLESKRDTLLLLDEDGNQCDKLTINADIAKVKESTPPDPLVSDTRPSWQRIYSQSSVQERISGYVSGDSVQELSWYTWSIGAGWSQDSDYDRRRVKIITGGMTDPSSQTPYWGAETENQDVTLYTWGVDNRYYPSAAATRTIGSFYAGAVYISTSDIQLEKVTYTVSMSAEAVISPSDHCKTATYSESSGKYTMKSGYGIQISVDTHLSGDTQYCTGSQIANVLFPEFNYNRHSTTLYNRLLEKSGGSFVFRKNKYSTYNDRVHFTPIWFPDRKNYTVYVEVFDVWCPAGQLSVRLTDQIFINGNVYDDWHIAPTKP